MTDLRKHIASIHFNQLDERIKQKVAVDQCDKLARYIRVHAVRKQIYQMLEQINPVVEFGTSNGKKVFRVIDTADGKIATAYGENIARFAKVSPELMNVMVNQILNKQ